MPAILIGFIAEPILNEPVTSFIDQTILQKKSDLRITITSTYFLNRTSADIIDLSKTLGYNYHEGELQGWDTTPENFTTLVIDDNNLIFFPNYPTIFTSAVDSNDINYCVITTLTTKGNIEANERYNVKEWFEFENPNCEDCLQHTVSVYNAGNKEIEDQRVNIHGINRIYNITGNDYFWVYEDKSFEVRRQTFLKGDVIVGIFRQEIPHKSTINNEYIKFENTTYNVSVWNDG